MAQIHTIKDDDQKDPPGREVNILPTRRVHIHMRVHMQATVTKLLQQPDITAAKHRRHYRPSDDRPLKITGPQHAQSERAGPQPAASTKPDQQQPAHPNGYPSPREPGHPTHPMK